MTLLLMPNPGEIEGPSGYRMRVAEANLLPFRDIVASRLSVPKDSEKAHLILERWRVLEASPTIWVRSRVRCCPVCLALHDQGRIGWELLFADACAGCGHWLLDSCSACGEPLTWRRDALTRCGCGANLCEQTSPMAPTALVRMSRAMEQLALGLTTCELSTLNGLTVSQCSRLVRLLGAYGSPRHQRSPQKIVGADTLEVSWSISSFAAEVLANWPGGFHSFLNSHLSGTSVAAGRMQGVFGSFYRALYKGLPDPEFEWVRHAFEDFIAENWTGAIGRRNRRLPETVLARMAWIPAPEAASQLGMSMRRLDYLIHSGQVTAKRRTSAAGREFVMVRRQDVLAVRGDVTSALTLAKAASLLGLKRQRLGWLLPRICPDAVKLTLQGTPWVIPSTWLQGWLTLVCVTPVISEPSSDLVSLDFLLRYGPLDDHSVADLLNNIAKHKVQPIGRLGHCTGIAGLLLNRNAIDMYQRSGQQGLSAPETAERLGVKQEVIYALIRIGLLEEEERRDSRRKAAVISTSALDQFNTTYVFATEVARSINQSPRAVIRALLEDGIEPVAGPSLGNCRQVVYARSDLIHLPWLLLDSNLMRKTTRPVRQTSG